MASTNKTANYNLSQFVGTDKPAWLSDYNGDMGKIDAGIASAAATATGADGKADANATKIGNLANLTTTVKTDAVAAINEVNAAAGTAQGTASSASTTASAAKTTADGLQRYITLTDFGTATVTMNGGTINTSVTDMKFALNADGTYGKVYGRIRYTCNTTGVQTITINTNGHVKAGSQFTIAYGSYYYSMVGNAFAIMNTRDVTVNTDGTITLEMPSSIGNGNLVTIWFPPCIYYFTDFGDTPE